MNIRSLLTTMILAPILVSGCGGQEAAWQEAQEAGTIAAYQEYLDTYPESPQADQARQEIRALRRAEVWQQARQTDSIESYEQFLAEYSQGEEVEQARNRMADLQRQQAWESLRDSTDIAALRTFAQRHTDFPVAEQARRRIAELEQAQREAEARRKAEEERRRAEEAARTHRVQVAALRTEQQARDGARQLEEQLADVLGDTAIEVQQSGSYYLLRTAPMREEDAGALCDRMRAGGQECLVVAR